MGNNMGAEGQQGWDLAREKRKEEKKKKKNKKICTDTLRKISAGAVGQKSFVFLWN